MSGGSSSSIGGDEAKAEARLSRGTLVAVGAISGEIMAGDGSRESERACVRASILYEYEGPLRVGRTVARSGLDLY